MKGHLQFRTPCFVHHVYQPFPPNPQHPVQDLKDTVSILFISYFVTAWFCLKMMTNSKAEIIYIYHCTSQGCAQSVENIAQGIKTTPDSNPTTHCTMVRRHWKKLYVYICLQTTKRLNMLRSVSQSHSYKTKKMLTRYLCRRCLL